LPEEYVLIPCNQDHLLKSGPSVAGAVCAEDEEQPPHCGSDGSLLFIPWQNQDHLLPEEYVLKMRNNLLDRCPVSSYKEVSKIVLKVSMC